MEESALHGTLGEDIPPTTAMYRLRLEQDGYRVAVSADAHSGLKLTRRRSLGWFTWTFGCQSWRGFEWRGGTESAAGIAGRRGQQV